LKVAFQLCDALFVLRLLRSSLLCCLGGPLSSDMCCLLCAEQLCLQLHNLAGQGLLLLAAVRLYCLQLLLQPVNE
jgi:hypothetical protein